MSKLPWQSTQELLFDAGYVLNIIPWLEGWAVFVYVATEGKTSQSSPPQEVLRDRSPFDKLPAAVNVSFLSHTAYSQVFPTFQDAVRSLAVLFTNAGFAEGEEQS